MPFHKSIVAVVCGVSFFLSSPLMADEIRDEIRKIAAEVEKLPEDQVKMSYEKRNVFTKNFLSLSADMSPDKVRLILGNPDRIRTIGEVSFDRRRPPDLFTFYDYEITDAGKSKRSYRISIQFSRNRKKIVSVYQVSDDRK